MTCHCGRFIKCNPAACKAGLHIKRRGSLDWRSSRFGMQSDDKADKPSIAFKTDGVLHTQVIEMNCKTIISHNKSPDIPWSKSINPYAGCEHGCSYCYARPTHGYHQLSPGLDFETRLFAKMNAAEILETQLGAASYQPTTIVLGTNTDVYQPIERKYRLTRSLLEVCLEFGQPISILTKNSLIERDIDLLRELALLNLVEVHFTLTTLSTSLSQILEPRASLPNSRLKSIKTLTEAGIPVKVMCAPLIPKLNMMELKALMIAAKNVGATDFGYILLRLPFEVEGIFNDWLSTHFPNKHQEVLEALLRYRSNNNYTHRMEGSGYLAQTLKERFQHHYQALGYKTTSPDELNITSFKHRHYRGQLMLFK